METPLGHAPAVTHGHNGSSGSSASHNGSSGSSSSNGDGARGAQAGAYVAWCHEARALSVVRGAGEGVALRLGSGCGELVTFAPLLQVGV